MQSNNNKILVYDEENIISRKDAPFQLDADIYRSLCVLPEVLGLTDPALQKHSFHRHQHCTVAGGAAFFKIVQPGVQPPWAPCHHGFGKGIYGLCSDGFCDDSTGAD